MMGALLLRLCAVAVFCGLALNLTPEGSVKRITSMVCALILLLSLMRGVGKLDWKEYSLAVSKVREHEQSLRQSGEELRDRLDRLVIERELTAYIQDKATELGISIQALTVTLRWDGDGLWVPEGLAGQASGTTDALRRLEGTVTAELGIPREQQQWSLYEGTTFDH